MEIWDAYNENMEKTGLYLIRGRRIPDGFYHAVAEIFVLHTDGSILLMRRDPNKPNYPDMWEAGAGGAVQADESFEEAAFRELSEETGIKADKLTSLYTVCERDRRTIYAGFLCVTDCPKNAVALQEGETAGYKWITADEFMDFLDSDGYIPTFRERSRKYFAAEILKRGL